MGNTDNFKKTNPVFVAVDELQEAAKNNPALKEHAEYYEYQKYIHNGQWVKEATEKVVTVLTNIKKRELEEEKQKMIDDIIKSFNKTFFGKSYLISLCGLRHFFKKYYLIHSIENNDKLDNAVLTNSEKVILYIISKIF